jgi:hypothetical protein
VSHPPEHAPSNDLPDVILDYAAWEKKIEQLANTYAAAEPYPHTALDDLLAPGVTKQLEKDIPAPDHGTWTHYRHVNERKQGKSRRDELPASVLRVVDEFNSERFRGLLSRLTGVPDLVADTDFRAGGGLSICTRGGFLNVHTDFTVHPYQVHWRRRVNLIFFLNHGWDETWGGHTELWDAEVRNPVVRVAPHANRALVFNTDIPSYHGHPDPLQCPEGVARQTLALYYFTEERSPVSIATDYRARPSDSITRRVLIRCDRLLLSVYHVLKQKLGLDDAFASRVLARFARLQERLFRK